MFNLKSRYSGEELEIFAEKIKEISEQIGFKVSSRGWAYLLETARMINKDQFDRVTNLINKCRTEGYLPIDFVSEDSARMFAGVEEPDTGNVINLFSDWLNSCRYNVYKAFTPNWWEGEEYYIQIVVEKVDLVTLFKPICKIYHIPIANAKGWSSMLQRATYAQRFQDAEDNDLKCVLLYCGDHDPDGLRISEHLRKNLEDLRNVVWEGGGTGYDPANLIIDRFGLNFDFIVNNNLTWIDNLITGSKKNLASPAHKNYHMEYLQSYLKQYGARKCEANAIVTMPNAARRLVRNAIEYYLGPDAEFRFLAKREAVKEEFENFMKDYELDEIFNKIQSAIEDYID